MSDLNELDEAARHAHDALDYLRKQYEQAAKPFLDRLATIENIRPRSYVVDGKTFMPIDLPKPERPSQPPTDDIVAGLRLVSNELGKQQRYAMRTRVDRAIAALGEKGWHQSHKMDSHCIACGLSTEDGRIKQACDP